METKINIAAILKDKPRGTKLYSPIFGNLRYEDLVPDLGEFTIITSDNTSAKHSFWSDGRYNRHGEPLMLLPSKEMRDWRKFAWKKGDLLINSSGFQCIFKEWASGDYTKFNGCYSNSRDGYEDVSNAETAKFDKLDHNIAYGYVREIERELGGKLNLETLEIEKTQPEFKDGDIVVTDAVPSLCYSKCILILKGDLNTNKNSANYYVFYNINNNVIYFNIHDTTIRDRNIHLATEEEKQQLFSALKKENKAWDADKKMFVYLKPKVELKPFDKVLCRNSKDDTWEADFFARLTRKEIDYTQSDKYLCVGDLWMYCIPYNEETAHLLGTTDDWEGGEQ